MLETPEVEGHLHHKTGHNLTDKILAVSAIFLSGVSVFIAVHHGQTMERLVAANTWPNISYSSGNESDDHARHDVTLKLKNTGVGPARIDTFEVFYKDKPLSGQLGFAGCCGAGLRNSSSSQVLDEVLPARESIEFVGVPQEGNSKAAWENANAERLNVRVRICYCSVFDECFARDSRRPRPERVDACKPSQPVQYR